MKILKIIIVTLLIVNCFILINSVKAADLEIICAQKDCIKSTDYPLFSSNDGLWFPGKIVTRTITLKNISNFEQSISIQNNQKSDQGNLDEVLYLRLINNKTSRVIWEGFLSKNNINKSVNLGKLKAGDNFELKTSLQMIKSAPLNYQKQQTIFDINFIFTGNNSNDKVEPKKSGQVLGQSIDTQADISLFSRFWHTIQDFFQKLLTFFS